MKCSRCSEILFNKELDHNHKVCLKCGYHFRVPAHERMEMTLDEGSFREMDAGMLPVNPLNLPDYGDKLDSAVKKTGLKEAVVTGEVYWRLSRCNGGHGRPLHDGEYGYRCGREDHQGH